MSHQINLVIAIELKLDLVLLLLPVVVLQPAADEEDADGGGGGDAERAQRPDPVHPQLPHPEHHALRPRLLPLLLLLLLLLAAAVVVAVDHLGIGALERLLLLLLCYLGRHGLFLARLGLGRHGHVDADVLALVVDGHVGGGGVKIRFLGFLSCHPIDHRNKNETQSFVTNPKS
ncbi:Os07g0204250 [Oryza sativa Japonica Group]|uniref:Os07g0204250 protein n=1 Tax=Oryza sativa subsp. japonica TaxID=39947 RepID=A0A0P0X3L1_ORYSJ|nr:hypothetical protein EE612_037745 [Oryza sativa]BAT00529.1 Os07g0204250 [Oryza sativa Japonica Group]